MSILKPKIFYLPILLALLSPLLSSCENSVPTQSFRLLTFGTHVDLEIIGVEPSKAMAAHQQLQQDFDTMHKAWHAWDPGPVARINQYISENKTLVAPPSVLPLLKVSQHLARQSDYLFDPGIGQLVKLWGFHSSTLPKQPPGQEAITTLLQQAPSIADILIQGIHLSSNNRAVKLDFGAIGKGYGIDKAIQRLYEMGIDNAIINAGGDLRAIGSRGGKPWRIAIRNPQNGGIYALLPVQGNEAVFTSGNYERNFIWQTKRYHHIIDPRTGHPAEGTASVTVLHPDATTADAAATALFIAGPENWHRIARQMGIKYVLLIDTEGNAHMNPAMQKRIELRISGSNIVVSKPL
jgi:thiamine biosynthesis lipoprotein